VAEATNKVSQHIFHKLRSIPQVERAHRNYLFHGRPIIQAVADAGRPVLMEKSLVSLPREDTASFSETSDQPPSKRLRQ